MSNRRINLLAILDIIGIIAVASTLSSCGFILPNSRYTDIQTNTNTNNTSANSNTHVAGTPGILGFSPSAGKVTAMPSTVQVVFSESTMNTDTVKNLNNWSYACSGQAQVTPTNITVLNSIATLTLPVLIQPSSSGSCILKASTTITNQAGKAITGTVSATYQFGSSETTSTLKFTSLRAGDRISGTVPLHLVAFTSGPNSQKISSVYFYVDSMGLGSATADTDGGFSYSFQTSYFQNGPHTIRVSAISATQTESTDVATINVNIQNQSSYSSSPSAGGTGGYPFTAQAPAGMVLFGIRVGYNGSNGNYISNIMPIWRNSYGTNLSMSYNGLYFGGTTGSPNYIDLTCPEAAEGTPSYAVSGFTGKASTQVFALGVICKQQYDSSNPSTSTIVGGSSGTAFKNECPANTFMTYISGRADNNALIQLQGYCN